MLEFQIYQTWAIQNNQEGCPEIFNIFGHYYKYFDSTESFFILFASALQVTSMKLKGRKLSYYWTEI